MTVHRFYINQQLAESSSIELSGERVRQIRRVLRLTEGDWLTLFDGSGIEVMAVIKGFSGDRLDCEIQGSSYPTRGPGVEVTVGLSLIRRHRFENAIQKLTEIGVVAVVPLVAARSVVQMSAGDRWNKWRNRLKKIAIEASEQSERTVLPEISDPEPITAFVMRGDCVALSERRAVEPVGSINLGSHVSIAVGPEGGWSAEELNLFKVAEVTEVSLGSLVLRSETAAIVAASSLIQRSFATANKRGQCQ